MNEQTKSESKPDDLTKTTETGSIDLTEQELDRVSGGDILISSVQPIKPPVNPLLPVDGYTPVGG